jgi:hypothetical protein
MKRATEQQIRALLWSIIDQSTEPKLTAALIADRAHQQLSDAAHAVRLRRIASHILKTAFIRRREFDV